MAKKLILHLKESYNRIRKRVAPPTKIIPNKKKEVNKYFCRKKNDNENNK